MLLSENMIKRYRIRNGDKQQDIGDDQSKDREGVSENDK